MPRPVEPESKTKGMVFQVKKDCKNSKGLEMVSPEGSRMTLQQMEMKLDKETGTPVSITTAEDQVVIRSMEAGSRPDFEAKANRVEWNEESCQLTLEGNVSVRHKGCCMEPKTGKVSISFPGGQPGMTSCPRQAQ